MWGRIGIRRGPDEPDRGPGVCDRRYPSLGEAARRRFSALGYGNIELRVGDGTLGWPEPAPFDAILCFPLDLDRDGALCCRLMAPRLERFIGVIYRPETELTSHYADASLPQQFDAYVWLDETSAITPLGPAHHRPGMPETYPFGL